jgi:glycosyltransferase involved in cell wall biosynthesis
VVLSLKQANIVGRLALLPFPATRCIAFEHIAKLEKGRLAGLYEFALKRLAFRVNEVWADCQATLVDTRAYFPVRTQRTERVVPLFICDPQPDPKSDYAINGPLRLVVAGRLIPRKRHDLILRAMQGLKARGVDTVLTIFGEGPEEGRIRALAEQSGLGAQVTFAGFHADWWRQARGHDVFIHPSDEEGFCIVVAEAMMAGLPVICTPVGGVRDFGQEGTVVFSPVGSVEGCEAAIMMLLSDDALRERVGRAAAKSISARYSDSAMRVEVDRLTAALAERAF